MNNPLPVIIDIDQSINQFDGSNLISASQWQDEIRFACTNKQFNLFADFLYPLLPEKMGTVFLGSGDFHHLSLLLIKKLSQQYSASNPIQIIVLDNHPDNMRYPFGIHCGSWISHAAKLDFVSHIHVVGITSDDIGIKHCWENRLIPLFKNKLTYWSINVDVNWAKKIGLTDRFKPFNSADELVSDFLAYQKDQSEPIYLSIDKDVLSKKVVETNWDQGIFDLQHILSITSAMNNRIIASDITGEISYWQYKSKMKRMLSYLDKQIQMDKKEISKWQEAHYKINQQLLSALTNG